MHPVELGHSWQTKVSEGACRQPGSTRCREAAEVDEDDGCGSGASATCRKNVLPVPRSSCGSRPTPGSRGLLDAKLVRPVGQLANSRRLT
jgi:hypothetical protein